MGSCASVATVDCWYFLGMSDGGDLRALMVCYVWPPTGGAGVQRVLKLTKYLPDFGVDPSVLTVANPSVPLRDESLERDIRPDLEIVRARTLEPGYGLKQATWQSAAATRPTPLSRLKKLATGAAKSALFPDPQVLWQPAAAAALVRRLAQTPREDVVFISAPPFSQFLSAPLARMRPGTAVVLDYRDEWSTLRKSYEMLSRVGLLVGDPLEAALLRSAHAVTTATEAFRKNLLERFSFLSPERVVAVPNGYDPADYPEQLPSPPRDRFTITYAGTLFRLTSPRGLIGAIRRLHEREPELARLLHCRFIGRIVDTEQELFEGTEELGIEQVGFIPQGQVSAELAASHLVLCLLDDVEGVERIYPAKIFELMYLRRPCLTLAPGGALTELVERHRLGAVFAPRDETAIAGFLEAALREFRDGSYRLEQQPVDIDRYHRRALAGQFADVFRAAVARARGQA